MLLIVFCLLLKADLFAKEFREPGDIFNHELESADRKAEKGDTKAALKHIHTALRIANGLPDAGAKMEKTLRFMVGIYQICGLKDRALTVSNLVLTPASLPGDPVIVRLHKQAVRRIEVMDAGDQAMKMKDYLLADVLFSTLLPSPTIIERIFSQSATADEFEVKIVDRLVRLYLEHGDIDRAKSLVEKMRVEVTALSSSNPSRDATRLKLAMLDADLALVRLKQDRFAEADKLLSDSAVDIQRQIGPDDPQLATIYADLAHISALRERFPEAASRYKRALKIADRSGRVRKVTLRSILLSYSKVLERLKKIETAEQLALRAQLILDDD